jgi:hypothetical protein
MFSVSFSKYETQKFDDTGWRGKEIGHKRERERERVNGEKKGNRPIVVFFFAIGLEKEL